MLAREAIVEGLKKIIDADRVITNEEVLKESSVDRFLKYQTVFGVYTLPLPAAVVKVHSTEEIKEILMFANEHDINCVPRTGFTATEGGLETRAENSIVIDGSEMKKVINIDPYNMQATVQCGVVLQDLEDEVRKLGLTTGHSPQSKPLAQYGGLTATRSIGQFSTLYGAIEDMIVGLEAVFPNGHIARIKNVPRRSGGPDIRHVVIGNEGSLCFISEVTIKLHKYYPENNRYFGYLLDDMQPGFEALREIIVNGFRPSVIRLYDAGDAQQHFSHFNEGKHVMLFMAEGPKGIVDATAEEIQRVAAKTPGCKEVDPKLIENWFDNLNWGPDRIAQEREDIKKNKHMGFTTEISADWEKIQIIYKEALKRVKEEFPRYEDITMLGGHSSHSYINGTNMYFVYDYNVTNCPPEREVYEYHIPLNKIFVEEALKHGGSMCHHHGIGKHRAPWTKEEHGTAYYILEGLKKQFDPNGIMNKENIFLND